jgi:DNA polymerase-3 subunit alpha
VTGNLAFDEYRDSWSLRAEEVRTLEAAREASAHALLLRLAVGDPDDQAGVAALVGQLRSTLGAFRGGRVPVVIEYRRSVARGLLRLGDGWRVQPTDELIKRLRRLLGADGVQVSYRGGAHQRPGREQPAPAPRLAVVR